MIALAVATVSFSILSTTLVATALAQTTLSPNGYSGLAMTPSAQTIPGGLGVTDRSTALAGALFSGQGPKVLRGTTRRLASD